MTQDEIIDMACKAGVIATRIDGLESFAKLVAAKEREACAKVCDDLYEEMYPDIEFGGVSSAAEKIRARGEA